MVTILTLQAKECGGYANYLHVQANYIFSTYEVTTEWISGSIGPIVSQNSINLLAFIHQHIPSSTEGQRSLGIEINLDPGSNSTQNV